MNVQPPSNQLIIDCLSADYGIKLVKLIALSVGADINALVYKADAHDQSSYFIKLKRGHDRDISATIISLLHDVGIQQIIIPIKSNDGQINKRINEYTLTVFPFIVGQNGFSRDLTDEQWVALGEVMRQIHTIEVPAAVRRIIRYEDYSPKWREAVRLLYKHIESEPKVDKISSDLMAFMTSHVNTIHRLVDTAEQLSKKIQDQLPEFVLCHSDIHGGNVLIDDCGNFYIVDWDDPIMAPKERDLMFVGGGVANTWNRAHEEKLFYKGYGEAEIDMASLAYYRCERIVEDMAIYGRHILLASDADQSRVESYKHFIAQFEPNGVVEIAFDTYNNLIKR